MSTHLHLQGQSSLFKGDGEMTVKPAIVVIGAGRKIGRDFSDISSNDRDVPLSSLNPTSRWWRDWWREEVAGWR